MVSLFVTPVVLPLFYINPFSLKLKNPFLPTIIWSITSTPKILPASINLFVIVISSSEGSGSPEGWLWAKTTDAALLSRQLSSVG